MDNEHYTILLIEDDPTYVEFVRGALSESRGMSFELEHADQLRSGLERLAAGEIDLVLLDLGLPDSQGLDTLRKLRSQAARVPVVVLTCLDDETTAIEASQRGAQDYLDKGHIDGNLLVRSLHYVIRRSCADEALRVSEACFRNMIYNNADGILIVDPQGIVRHINPAAQSLFGGRAEQLLDQPFGFPIVAEETAEVDIVSMGRGSVTAEMRAAEMTWKGQPVHIVSLRDVTEHKRLLEELEQHRRQELQAKDQFISHVSHELRSPLAAVYEFVTILLDGLAGDITEQQGEHLETILRNVIQLKTMIDDLLDITRAQTGKLTVQPRYLPLAENVHAAIEACGRAASTKGLALSAELLDELPPVYADGQRVQQIVTNLINNAVKFTPEDGSITIRAGIDENDPDFLSISVSDTGCGIGHGDCERIFEQMYQVQCNGEAGRKGLGLGLHICKELVSRQGGRIWVESRLREGSTFFFTLPIFSLAKTLGPILTDANLLGGTMALIAVGVASRDGRALGKVEEAAMEEVWDILDRCIIRAMDVVLPRTPRKQTRETFYVAACVDEDGEEALVQRIRQQLAGCDALRTAGLAATILSTRIDLASLTDNATPGEIDKHVASRIEDLVMTPA